LFEDSNAYYLCVRWLLRNFEAPAMFPHQVAITMGAWQKMFKNGPARLQANWTC
jgi:hypothetical protein